MEFFDQPGEFFVVNKNEVTLENLTESSIHERGQGSSEGIPEPKHALVVEGIFGTD
jgi:hypothetical protein